MDLKGASVDEEDSGARQSGQGVGHPTDPGVVDESPEEEQEACKGERGRNSGRQASFSSCFLLSDLLFFIGRFIHIK